jgi:hypothetical protein
MTELVKKEAPSPTEGKSYRNAYLDAISGPEGRYSRFKDGKFITTDDGAEMDTAADYVCLFKETRISWKRFEEGETPTVQGGLLFDDSYVLPRREELGDIDESEWPEGLDGKPSDPWQHFIEIVLQRLDTAEIFLFSASTITARKAVGALLRHCERASRNEPDYAPIVKLRTGSFKHRDSRIGQVIVPSFVVVGSKKKSAAEKLDDSIPF